MLDMRYLRPIPLRRLPAYHDRAIVADRPVFSDNPVVTLNHAVAVAMARGPQAGLDLLAVLDADERIASDHRLPAVRAHLLELAGDTAGALHWYRTAAERSRSLPLQRYLNARAARLSGS
jgi:predicted RNA polymerase sigma factor